MVAVDTWTLDQLSERDRIDAWRESISATHLAWDIRPSAATVVDGSGPIQRYRLGGIDLVTCSAGPCEGARGQRQISADDDGYLGVLFLLAGKEMVAQGDKRAVLTAGCATIWDASRPARFAVADRVCKRTLLIPRARVAELWPTPEKLLGADLTGTGTGYLDALLGAVAASPPARLAGRDAVAVGNAVLELLFATVGSLGADEGARGDRWNVVRDYIEDNLADPGLDAHRVARSAAISVRSLYLLFQQREDTVRSYIRRRRLARCRTDLERADESTTVARVAHRWGFADQATFSTAFKRQYGVTPNEVRLRQAR